MYIVCGFKDVYKNFRKAITIMYRLSKRTCRRNNEHLFRE